MKIKKLMASFLAIMLIFSTALASNILAKEQQTAKISTVTYDKVTQKSTKTVGELNFVVKNGFPLKEVTKFQSIDGVAEMPQLKDGFYNVTLEENNYYQMSDTPVTVENGTWTFDDEDGDNILTVEKKEGIEVPSPKPNEEEIEKVLLVQGDNISNLSGLEFEISDGKNKEKVVVDNNGALNLKIKENKSYILKLLSTENYKIEDISFKCEKGVSDFGTPIYKLIGNDNKEISSINLTKKQKVRQEQEFTFNVLCGSCGKISIAKEMNFKVEDNLGNKKIYKSNQGIVKFNLLEGSKYQVSLQKDSDYSMDIVNIEVKNIEGELKVYSDNKIFKDFIMTKISNTECVETLCSFSDKKIKMAEIPVKVNENGLLRDLKADEEIIFDLYDTSKSEPVGEVKTVGGKIPSLEVYEKDDYILFTSEKNKKFIMADTPFNREVSELYFISNGTGKLPIRHKTKNPYAEGAKLNIDYLEVRHLEKDEQVYKKYYIDYVRIKQDKDNPQDYSKVKFIFTSEYDTVTATTLQEDQWGVPLTGIELLENVQYSVRVEDPEGKYAIENFPFVLVDKSERGPHHPLGWGDGKYVFNHSYCGNATFLTLVKKGTENDHNTEIVCSSGNTTITGMNFRDLKLRTIHPDKSEVANIAELKNKEFDLYRFKLINPKRCEVTKMADGNFAIHRKIKDNKIVEKVYQVNKDKTLTELKFKQNKNIVDIDTKTLSIYDTVILYKDNNEKSLEEAKTKAIAELEKLDSLTSEEKDRFKEEINKATEKAKVSEALDQAKAKNTANKELKEAKEKAVKEVAELKNLTEAEKTKAALEINKANSVAEVSTALGKAKELDKKHGAENPNVNPNPAPDVTPTPTPTPEVKADWKKDEKGTKYQKENGSFAKAEWEPVNGTWYHFDENGYMQIGWINTGGAWYYLNADGSMAKDTWIGTYYVDASGAWVIEGWQNSGYGWWYQRANGTYPSNEWEIINGIWYYFDENGYMLADTTTPDGYYVDLNGAWVK